MLEGWICPRCGQVWAPLVDRCSCVAQGSIVLSNNTGETCPACGRPRSEPGGTGCPMSAHYGPYCSAG